MPVIRVGPGLIAAAASLSAAVTAQITDDDSDSMITQAGMMDPVTARVASLGA